MARGRSRVWAALVAVILLILVVLVFVQVRPDRHDDMAETWITTQVQARLVADTDIRARDIAAVTRDGVVTLTGEVASEQERQRAIALAREVDGVRQVQDGLFVRPELVEDMPREDPRRDEVATTGEPAPVQERESRPPRERLDDGWITTQIQAQYFVATDIRAREIDVSTTDGVVTLTGEVGSEAERQQAVRIARETRGVRQVEDGLTVRP